MKNAGTRSRAVGTRIATLGNGSTVLRTPAMQPGSVKGGQLLVAGHLHDLGIELREVQA